MERSIVLADVDGLERRFSLFELDVRRYAAACEEIPDAGAGEGYRPNPPPPYTGTLTPSLGYLVAFDRAV